MNQNQTLKQRVIDYSYTYLKPHVHDLVLFNIGTINDDLSNLRDEKPFLYDLLIGNVKNKELLQEIEFSVLEEKSKIDINSAFIGAIIGLLIGIAICVVVNLIPR